MTASEALATQEGGAEVPRPLPAAVDPAHDGDDYRYDRGLLDSIWDYVAVQGTVPTTDTDLNKMRTAIPIPVGVWRDYVRWNQDKVSLSDYSQARETEAAKWMIRHEIEVGLRNGYLVKDSGGRLSIGPPPPSHRPFDTYASARERTPEQVERGLKRLQYSQEDNLWAYTVLMRTKNGSDLARIMPTKKGKDSDYQRIKESIQTRGLWDPIIAWLPSGEHRSSIDDAIIVDGMTRLDVLKDLGIKVDMDDPEQVQWLPADTPAMEVLYRRIGYETARKSTDECIREALAVRLATPVKVKAEIWWSARRRRSPR